MLELLAAMSLMVVVASCMYTALYTGFRAYRGAQEAVDPTLTALNAIEVMKQDLSGVLPPGSHLAGAFIGTDSGGLKGVDADSLEFYTTHIFTDDAQLVEGTVTTPVPGLTDGSTPAIGGIGKVAFLLEEDTEAKDGTYLLLRQTTTNLLAPTDLQPAEQVLCQGVISLNFRYHDGTDWVDSWDSTADANSLPLAVEVDLQVARQTKYDKEQKKRRLVQSFLLPCKSDTSTTDATTSGTSTGTGSTSPSSSKSSSSSSSSKTSGS